MPEDGTSQRASPTAGAVFGRLLELGFVWVAIFVGRLLLAAERDNITSARAVVQAAAGVADRQTVAVAVASVVALTGHEAGHALVALALRVQILEVRIGVGPTVLRVRRLQVRLFPIGGRVLVMPSARGYPAILVGGAAANVVLALVTWWVTTSESLHDFRWALVLVQVYFVLCNAIPMRLNGQSNDARRLVLWRRGVRPAPVLQRGFVIPVDPTGTVAGTGRTVEQTSGDADLRRRFLSLVDAGGVHEARRFFDRHAERLGSDRHMLERLLPPVDG